MVGGYAVGYYGYPRSTGDIDLWVAIHPDNAQKLVRVLQEFGFASAGGDTTLFKQPGKVIRMGVPPVRIELLTGVSGCDFAECYALRTHGILDGVEVDIISLQHLKKNKRAAGRHKDLNDLENLP